MDTIATLRGDLTDAAVLVYGILRRFAGRTKVAVIPRAEILEARGLKPNDDIAHIWLDTAMRELEECGDIERCGLDSWRINPPAVEAALVKHLTRAKPTAKQRRAPFITTATEIVSEYSRRVKGRSNGDTSREQAIQNVAELLFRKVPPATLRAAIANYAADCSALETERQFRKSVGNFFGGEAVWKTYADATPIKADTGRPPSRRMLT